MNINKNIFYFLYILKKDFKMSKYLRTKFQDYLSEQTNTELNIEYLFRKYSNQLDDEFTNEDWVGRKDELIHGLRKSLEMVGDGEITEKDSYDVDGDRLMYVEKFRSDSLILVIHAAFERQPYGGGKMYRYEVSVYKNNPRSEQIGGGYGASGIVTIKHTCLMSSIDNYTRNKLVLSKVCSDIKQYAEQNF